jgi:pSer/pThr/pTyr-binding forkhead associated (FHA) protein
VFPLQAGEVAIGRRSDSRGIHPDIDLSGAVADPGVSHRHALLVRRVDGGYDVVDTESTNGTTMNDGVEAIGPSVPVELVDGDRVHVGAWTTITVRQRQL